MTVGELIQNKINKCIKNALLYLNKNDAQMVLFWLSARNGFIEKRNNLTLEKLRMEAE